MLTLAVDDSYSIEVFGADIELIEDNSFLSTLKFHFFILKESFQ